MSKRSSYLPPEDEYLGYPEPMPATEVTHASPRLWRGLGYAFLFEAVIVATICLIAASAAIAIGAGLSIIWGI